MFAKIITLSAIVIFMSGCGLEPGECIIQDMGYRGIVQAALKCKCEDGTIVEISRTMDANLYSTGDVIKYDACGEFEF